eukprot:1137881-Pelagomonas_calceolata.AAC.1
MGTVHHNIASRILLLGISKGPLRAGLASMDIGSADYLALQKLQPPKHSTTRILPTYIFLCGGHGGNREHSVPATATLHAYKVRHPSQLLPEQRHIHLVGVKYCADTRPKDQLEASKQQQCNLCCDLLRASAQVTLHTILLDMGGVVYTPHTQEPLKDLGLDTHTSSHQACQECLKPAVL